MRRIEPTPLVTDVFCSECWHPLAARFESVEYHGISLVVRPCEHCLESEAECAREGCQGLHTAPAAPVDMVAVARQALGLGRAA